MAFDTHAFVKKLQGAGFTPQQAEAQVEVLVAVVEDNLASKKDLKEMESRLVLKMELMRRDTIIWLGGIVLAGFALAAAISGVVIASIQLR